MFLSRFTRPFLGTEALDDFLQRIVDCRGLDQEESQASLMERFNFWKELIGCQLAEEDEHFAE